NLCPLCFIGTPKDAYIKGLIAVYEYRDVALLRDVFAHAYSVSCDRYPLIAASLDKPDPIRLRHREAIKATVSAVVSRETPPEEINSAVSELINDIPAEDRDAVHRFILEDLASLHEGNIARSRLSSHDFSKWEKLWPDADTRAARLRALAQEGSASKHAGVWSYPSERGDYDGRGGTNSRHPLHSAKLSACRTRTKPISSWPLLRALSSTARTRAAFAD